MTSAASCSCAQIAIADGLHPVHNGPNFMTVACKLATDKAATFLRPFIRQVRGAACVSFCCPADAASNHHAGKRDLTSTLLLKMHGCTPPARRHADWTTSVIVTATDFGVVPSQGCGMSVHAFPRVRTLGLPYPGWMGQLQWLLLFRYPPWSCSYEPFTLFL